MICFNWNSPFAPTGQDSKFGFFSTDLLRLRRMIEIHFVYNYYYGGKRK